MLHRAMHIPGAEQGPNGYPVGAVMGCLQSLTSIVRILLPARCFWVHDRDKHPNRMRLYPTYKAKAYKTEEDRQEAEQYRESYLKQRDLLLQVLPLLGVHVVFGPYESDDTIWYMSGFCSSMGIPSMICTEDKDFVQLLSDTVSVYSPQKEITVSRGTWQDWSKWAPDQIVLVKAILGDASDNIESPCNGLGEIGLQKLMTQSPAPTLENLAATVKEKFPNVKKYASLLDAGVQARIQANMQLISFWAGLAFQSQEERTFVWEEWCKRSWHNQQGVVQFLSQFEMSKLMRMYGMWATAFQGLV